VVRDSRAQGDSRLQCCPWAYPWCPVGPRLIRAASPSLQRARRSPPQRSALAAALSYNWAKVSIWFMFIKSIWSGKEAGALVFSVLDTWPAFLIAFSSFFDHGENVPFGNINKLHNLRGYQKPGKAHATLLPEQRGWPSLRWPNPRWLNPR